VRPSTTSSRPTGPREPPGRPRSRSRQWRTGRHRRGGPPRAARAPPPSGRDRATGRRDPTRRPRPASPLRSARSAARTPREN
jgi:hypothetical protein